MRDLIEKATQEIGTKEIPGAKDHNARIVEYAQEAGFKWVDDDETPWCSIFMNWVAQQTGYERTKKANARSWLKVGTPTDAEPKPGDVVIFWRESPKSWKGHVGIYLGISPGREDSIMCLGGNQSNQVCIQHYDKERILGFRRLRKLKQQAPVVTAPKFKESSGVITRFLKEKGTKEFQEDKNKFLKYPILFSDHEGVLKNGYLQDAVRRYSNTRHQLELIVLSENKTSIYHIRKTCRAPEGCTIDWDKVHCVYQVAPTAL